MATSDLETGSHLDKLGKELLEGDFVIYCRDNVLRLGTITKINPKMVKISEVGVKGFWARGTNHYPQDVVKFNSPDVTMYILKMSK